MIAWIRRQFRVKTNAQLVEEYLADSASIYDLERRMRELDRMGYTSYR